MDVGNEIDDVGLPALTDRPAKGWAAKPGLAPRLAAEKSLAKALGRLIRSRRFVPKEQRVNLDLAVTASRPYNTQSWTSVEARQLLGGDSLLCLK